MKGLNAVKKQDDGKKPINNGTTTKTIYDTKLGDYTAYHPTGRKII